MATLNWYRFGPLLSTEIFFCYFIDHPGVCTKHNATMEKLGGLQLPLEWAFTHSEAMGTE